MLALLLERLAEQVYNDTWRNIRDHLKQIKLAQLSSPIGMVWQVREAPPQALKRIRSERAGPRMHVRRAKPTVRFRWQARTKQPDIPLEIVANTGTLPVETRPIDPRKKIVGESTARPESIGISPLRREFQSVVRCQACAAPLGPQASPTRDASLRLRPSRDKGECPHTICDRTAIVDDSAQSLE